MARLKPTVTMCCGRRAAALQTAKAEAERNGHLAHARVDVRFEDVRLSRTRRRHRFRFPRPRPSGFRSRRDSHPANPPPPACKAKRLRSSGRRGTRARRRGRRASCGDTTAPLRRPVGVRRLPILGSPARMHGNRPLRDRTAERWFSIFMPRSGAHGGMWAVSEASGVRSG